MGTNLWRTLTSAVLLICSALASGCRVVEETGSPPAFLPSAGFTVNTTFREFYRLLGGQEVLGPAISPLIDAGSLQIQYSANALMRYDSGAAPGDQFSLAPLALEWGLQDPPLPIPDQPGVRIVEGYRVYEEFVPLYDQLQGGRFCGEPLTQVRLNATARRIEQYFENAGFYRSLDDPAGQVHLLAYGVKKCSQACSAYPDPAASVQDLSGPPQVFLSAIARTGSDLFGAPLSAPYLAADGQIEQIYAGVVIAAPPGEISAAHLRPAARMSGFPSHPPVERLDDPRLVFYPVDGSLGYNIPVVFQDYIQRHGGMEMAGLPVSEMYPEGGYYRQCFENYCLDYDPAAEAGTRVRPAPVGGQYLALYPPADQPALASSPKPAALDVIVSEAHPMLSPGQAQQITLQILDQADGTPIPGASASLTLFLPDDTQAEFDFPLTGADGRASLTLPIYPGGPGTLYPYKVCLQDPASATCRTDSFLIWEG